MKAFIAIALSASLLIGCGATLPGHEVWRPWSRILGDNGSIRTGSTVLVEVSGSTVPLLGDESLLAGKLKFDIEHLLYRRGFRFSGEEPDYSLLVQYSTEAVDNLVLSSSRFSYNLSRSYLGMSSGSSSSTGQHHSGVSALGVSIATAVIALSSTSYAASSFDARTAVGYVHTLSLELREADGRLIWKGESKWETSSPDIYDNLGANVAMQLILSHLPRDPEALPWAPELKPTHVGKYFDTYCSDIWFSCPSLPYRISISGATDLGTPKYSWRKSVTDPTALPVFVDLMRTAEYAVPLGSDNYDDPLDLDLWKEVALGGEYFLGPDSQRVYALMKLIGEREGYILERAWLTNKEEYGEFQLQMRRWRESLADFFDMYRKF